MDTDKIQFTDKTVKLEKITLSRKKNKQKLNWIRLAERNKIPTDGKYINPRITFDGINWWISVGIEYTDNIEMPTNEGTGRQSRLWFQENQITKRLNSSRENKKTSRGFIEFFLTFLFFLLMFNSTSSYWKLGDAQSRTSIWNQLNCFFLTNIRTLLSIIRYFTSRTTIQSPSVHFMRLCLDGNWCRFQ